MPIPKGITRFNRVVANKATKPFARRLPWLGVLRHTGRVSGKPYETPLMAWRRGGNILVSLTYGSDVDWLKNARSEESVMTMGGKRVAVGQPIEIPRDEAMQSLPRAVRAALRALSVDEFVEFPVL